MNIYEPFDLGAFDPELAGRTLNILRNPTRKLRREFWLSNGEAFNAGVGAILGVEVGEIEPLFDDLDAALFKWLFVPVAGDGSISLPHVYQLWDAYAAERIKKLNAPPTPSAKDATGAPS
jgi:hypothetical protein